MFREMRRFKQQTSLEECVQVLRRSSACVLALAGDDGYPYAVPVSYAYIEDGGLGKVVFHGAKVGHKVDAIRRQEKVSLCVIDRDEVMPRERTTKFSSVVAFGRARILEDEEELRRAANAVGAKYSAGFEELYMKETEDTLRAGTLCCVEITLEHVTGKVGRQVLLERQKQEAAPCD